MTTNQQNNAAQVFWSEQMQKYPGVYAALLILRGVCSYIAVACDYIFNGHVILGAARWAITVGGRVATSILFFAALWVAGRSTEPLSMAHMLAIIPGGIKASQVDHLAILAFTLLPEVLLLGAGLTTIDQWVLVRRKGGINWVWAFIYSPFTAVFLGIAIYTFTSFITGSGAGMSVTGKADTATVIRALAGWGYALLELIHAGVSQRYGHADNANTPAQPTIDIQALINDALTAQAATYDQRMQQLASDQQSQIASLTGSLQALQLASPAPASIDVEALSEAIIRKVEAINEARFEALHEAAMKQTIVVSEAPAQRQIEAPKPRREAKNEAKQRTSNIVTLRQPNANPTEKRASVYRLSDNGEALSSYEIADQTGIPVSTVQRYLKERRKAQIEADSEATGTDL